MYDLHNVINLSVDVSYVLVLSYYLVNNKICLKQYGPCDLLNNCVLIHIFNQPVSVNTMTNINT